MNVACLLLPNFKINSELKRHPYLSKKQVLISGFVENKEVIVEYTNNINGVSNGSLLRDVLMKLKNPLIIEEDNQYYSYIFDNLLSGLFKVFDRIEPAKYKCMYIDISDLYIPSYGRNIEIAEEILNIIPECFNSQIGFSTGKYSSYIAALLSSPGKLNALEFNKTNIEKIPAHLLPVTDELKKRMYFLGLTSFGKIASLNKKDLLFQFGKEGGFIWDFVNGKDGSEIKPLKLKDKFSKEVKFHDATNNYDTLLVAVESLLFECFVLLETAKRYPKKISLICVLIGGFNWIKSVTFKTHEYDKEYAMNIFKKNLLTYPFSAPVEKITIQINELGDENGFQLNFFSGLRKESSLKNAIDEFKTRFDVESPFYKIRDLEPDSRIPERRKILVRYDP